MKTIHTIVYGDSRKMSKVEDNSVQLIVTSPPYWQLKDYGVAKQIGFNDTYDEYINNLNIVWSECYRVLEPGCRLCVNIGDQFTRSVNYGRYKVVPIHCEIIRFCETIGFDYMGSIIWQKPTTMHTTGGQRVMGSYPYPRGGIVKIDFEQILLFKKRGKAHPVSPTVKTASQLSDEEWQTYFSSHWTFPGAKQNFHIAVFPLELPKRLIKMFSFIGDTVLDPFMGSGTTALAAKNTGRNSIGYELNPQFRDYYIQKVMASESECQPEFYTCQDDSVIEIDKLVSSLPYRFIDIHKIDKIVDVKENNYGSVIEDLKIQAQSRATGSMNMRDLTVLVNHARSDSRLNMIEKGICYLRAGDTKGSLLVQQGFDLLQYLLLHTSGNQCQLFRLKNRGKFQIWTKETLEQYGFSPQHAEYYVVIHFDNHPIELEEVPQHLKGKDLFIPRILPLSEFKLKL